MPSDKDPSTELTTDDSLSEPDEEVFDVLSPSMEGASNEISHFFHDLKLIGRSTPEETLRCDLQSPIRTRDIRHAEERS